MRALLILTSLLAVGATPTTVSPGRFQTWYSFRRAPISFTSGGITISVAPLPCPVPATGDSTCRWDGYNNQGVVTVRAPGFAPVRVETDRQSEYAHIAVVRFDRRDPRPGVVIESQYGGSGGILTTRLLAPTATGFRSIALAEAGGGYLEGEIADYPADLSGDGVTDLVLADGRFGSVFGCNACTPRPPLVFAVKLGALMDESRDPALAGVFRRDMVARRTECFSDNPDRNGACAAYVADAARAGNFARAWAEMLRHYDRSATEFRSLGRMARGSFPASLRAFLTATGYLPARAPLAAGAPRR